MSKITAREEAVRDYTGPTLMDFSVALNLLKEGKVLTRVFFTQALAQSNWAKDGDTWKVFLYEGEIRIGLLTPEEVSDPDELDDQPFSPTTDSLLATDWHVYDPAQQAGD